MYYVRFRNPPCAGCGRSLAAAAARCPYCGMHARHSLVLPARAHAMRRERARPDGGPRGVRPERERTA